MTEWSCRRLDGVSAFVAYPAVQGGELRDEVEQSTQVTLVPSRPDPTPSVLLADASEVRAIVRAAREHLEMDIAFIGEFREGVRINRFIECVGEEHRWRGIGARGHQGHLCVVCSTSSRSSPP